LGIDFCDLMASKRLALQILCFVVLYRGICEPEAVEQLPDDTFQVLARRWVL
jgi:hypothetical protein